jgi:hypothetical protein
MGVPVKGAVSIRFTTPALGLDRPSRMRPPQPTARPVTVATRKNR